MTKRWTAVAQTFLVCFSVSLPLWQSVSNKYLVSELDQSLSGFQSHLPVCCPSVVRVWMDSGVAGCSAFLSCQQPRWERGSRFPLQSPKRRPRCWRPPRAPAWSLRPPARRCSPLKQTMWRDVTFTERRQPRSKLTCFIFRHAGLINFTVTWTFTKKLSCNLKFSLTCFYISTVLQKVLTVIEKCMNKLDYLNCCVIF